MKKNIFFIGVIITALTVAMALAATPKPQLTMDEQNLIVDSVIQTINPQGMMDSIVATVEARVLSQLANPSTAAASSPIPPPPAPTATVASATAIASPTVAAPTKTAIKTGETNPDGSYKGVHAKFVNSYAYTVGGDQGELKTFETEYTPNVLFNIDVVFENDGDTVWPALIEMRNVATSGTYTGHSPNVIVDTTYEPVVPGGKRAFSIAAHGSEDLGYHTFYFQLYDGVSGSLIGGGSGSFSYLAK
jgi:hypothetical protein